MAGQAKKNKPKTKPSIDPVSREKQLINLAVNLAEQQLRDGTAPASVINHYLKLASSREAIEREILEKQAELISAKANAIASDKKSEELFNQAIDALSTYKSDDQ